MTTTTLQKRDEKVQATLNQLEHGISELLESGKWAQYLNLQSKFHYYSYRNTILILLQCPDATRVAGFSTWKMLDRSVNKGEKGIAILAPLVRRLEESTDSETTHALIGFKTVYVFDVSQTDGEPMPQICPSLHGDDLGLYDRLETFVREDLNIPVETISLSGMYGYCQYHPYTHQPIQIAIDPSHAPLQRFKTLVHETAHALMHSHDEYRGHGQKSLRELEAESVAYCVCQYFGLETCEQSFEYITAMTRSEDTLSQLKIAGERIQKAVTRIIKAMDNAPAEATQLAA